MFCGVPTAIFLMTTGLQFGDRQSEKNQVCPAQCSLFPACCWVWESPFLTLKFNCACSQAPWFTLQDQTDLLSDGLFCCFIADDHFYQNTFLFNGLNMCSCSRMCLWQPLCDSPSHGADVTRQCFLLSVAGNVQILAVIGVWGWTFPKGVQIQ